MYHVVNLFSHIKNPRYLYCLIILEGYHLEKRDDLKRKNCFIILAEGIGTFDFPLARLFPSSLRRS